MSDKFNCSTAALAWISLCVFQTSVNAQVPKASDPQPAQKSQGGNVPASDVPKEDGEKSLDDLLGIGEDDAKKASDESGRAQKETLKRILGEQEAKNTLEATIDAMHRSATLLGEKESGTAVQRVQEDVLARLDMLIQSAQQQQQQQQSSSGSSSSSSQSKSSSQPKGGKGKTQSAAQASEEQRRAEAKRRAEQTAGKQDPAQQQSTGDRPGELPPGVDAVQGGVIQETEEEWGNLPPRTREIIRQGVREKMSSVYRRWTEAYYRRIAEEAKP